MSARYAAVHEVDKLAGPDDARPTAQQIIDDNNLRNGLVGKVVLITGCSSGLGIDTARAMKSTGAIVYATVRNMEKGKQALSDLIEPGKFELLFCNQSSFKSVNACADEFLKKSSTLNILINNAGIMAVSQRELTEDGFESQFAVNHLAHFLLFQRLKNTLLASATPEFPSRVVCVASSGHRRGPVNFDDINFDKEGSYEPFRAYGQAKTANIYMSNEIERRYGSQNLHAFSLHPGGIWTGLQSHLDTVKMGKGSAQIERMMKSSEQGAATSIVAAVEKELHGKGGLYLDNCQVAEPSKDGAPPGSPGYAVWAFDEEAAKRLWTLSLGFVGIKDDLE